MKPGLSSHLSALTEGPNIPLDKPIVLIGRHQECDIQIPSRKISRRHCCLAQVGDHLVVRDLGSTNGVRINGIKVVEGNLQPGDELMIGNVRYQLTTERENDAGGDPHNGFMAKNSHHANHGSNENSTEIPIALADASRMEQLPQGMPNPPPQNHGVSNPPKMELSGEIGQARP